MQRRRRRDAAHRRRRTSTATEFEDADEVRFDREPQPAPRVRRRPAPLPRLAPRAPRAAGRARGVPPAHPRVRDRRRRRGPLLAGHPPGRTAPDHLPGPRRRLTARLFERLWPLSGRHLMAAQLRHVDPNRRPGVFVRAYAALAATRFAKFVSRHVSWKIDPVLLRVTRGRVATTLVFPTALLKPRCPERCPTAQRDHLLPRWRPRDDRRIERRRGEPPGLVLQPVRASGRHLRWDPDAGDGRHRPGRTRAAVGTRRPGLPHVRELSTRDAVKAKRTIPIVQLTPPPTPRTKSTTRSARSRQRTLMDLSPTAAERALRDEIRAWLRANLPWEYGKGLPPRFDDLADEVAFGREWQAKLAERPAGSASAWPEEYGGRGAGPVEHYIVTEELARGPRAGARRPHRRQPRRPDAARARHRRAEGALAAAASSTRREIWCQLFSEPGAGSDLAVAARPRAERVDGGWRAQRPEGVDELRAVRRLGLVPRPHRPRRAEAARASPRSSSTCTRPASRCGRCARSPTSPSSTRCSSPTCSSPTTGSSARATKAGASRTRRSRTSAA